MEIEIGHYILNSQQQDPQSGKNYEIHNADTCPHLPDPVHQLSLGHFTDCELALAEAKQRVPAWAERMDGCAWCCPRCHTG
jgi:hypothetical protein